MESNNLKLRKYRIAVFLARYDIPTQRLIKSVLCKTLEVSLQTLHLYINATVGTESISMSDDKIRKVAAFFRVEVSRVVNDTEVNNDFIKELSV